MTKPVYEYDTSSEKPQGLKPWEQSVFEGLKAKGFPAHHGVVVRDVQGAVSSRSDRGSGQ